MLYFKQNDKNIEKNGRKRKKVKENVKLAKLLGTYKETISTNQNGMIRKLSFISSPNRAPQ